MRLLIDVDIFLDIFEKREPYFQSSYQAVHCSIENSVDCYLTVASAVILAHYLTNRNYPTEKVNSVLQSLRRLVNFAEVKAEDITSAIRSGVFDLNYISALFVASRIGADYILTRNPTWNGGRTPSISPEMFSHLDKYE